MLPKLRNKTLMKDLSQNPSSSMKKLDRKQKKLSKSKSEKANTVDLIEEKVLPTLIIEPSSDGEEFQTGSLDPYAIYQSKSRSLSYSSYDSIDESHLGNDADHSKYMKNYFRRRGKSVDIPKPCIHCILLEKFNLDNVSQSSDGDCFEKSTQDNKSDSEEIPTDGSKPDGMDSIDNQPVSPISPTINNNDSFSNFLKVPESKDVIDINSKPRSQSIDQIIDYLSLDKQNLSVEFIMINNNKPRAVSIDFNIPFHSKKASKSLHVTEGHIIINASDINRGQSAENIHLLFKPVPEWSIDSRNRTHIWVETNLSGDLCYLSDHDCEKAGVKKKCTSCKLIIHQLCIPKLKFQCRPTFREASVRDYRDEKKKEEILRHHWVHRKRQDGKCKQCGKTFQSKFSINSKEIVAVQCSWCKSPYHNKAVCFASSLMTEECTKGQHYDSIIPPSWIIKMATKNNFKSSVRKSRSPDSIPRSILPTESLFKNKLSNMDTISDSITLPHDDCLTEHITMTKSISFQNTSGLTSHIPFVIKPIPNSYPTKPLLVFLNPKSGGNLGAKLMRKFQWLLNPRQVFDITERGPRLGLELFGKIANLRILVCGGDGTVGWVMSEIDSLNIVPSPPIAILPLGTGNDLARTTNWGSGYTDEPLSKIISCVEEGIIKPLDRWNLTSTLITCPKKLCKEELLHQHREANSGIYLSDPLGPPSVSKLPLNVFNNYFSLGADAATALEFHESREANPEKFNSRLKNKIFYAGIGGKDVLKRSWKDLCDYVSLVCDGIDYTAKIKEMKPHLLLFLNIQRYSSGTLPWGNPSMGFGPQSFNDGMIEVVGLTAASLAALQVGGHADRICQCNSAIVRTVKTIPIQVDGEPCRLLPSEIIISHRNVAQIILKPKRRISVPLLSDYDEDSNKDYDQSVKLSVFVIPLVDYEENVMDKIRVMEAARFYGMITEKDGSNLATVRDNILHMTSDIGMLDRSFTFLDTTTTERFFRIPKDKEENHFLMDICLDDLLVLDPKLPSNLLPNENMTITINEMYPTVDLSISDEIPLTPGNLKSDNPTDFFVSSLNEEIQDENEKHPIINIVNTKEKIDQLIEDQNNDVKDSENDSDPPMRKYVNIEDLNNRFIDACKSMNVINVQKYIYDGADILAVDHDGLSGLHHAAIQGNIGVVHCLINDDSRDLLEMKDFINGQTALHKASAAGRQSICSLLISAGASLLVKDNYDRTPSQLSKDPQLLQFLQSKLPRISKL